MCVCTMVISLLTALQVKLARGEDYQWVAAKLEQLCEQFGTSVVQAPGSFGLKVM